MTTFKSQHPAYLNTDVRKWRLAYKGGQSFISAYLEKFSHRESTTDFHLRKKVTYCPAFAKAGVNEIKDSIFQRMVDISRIGGPSSFRKAVLGENGGVDSCNSSLNSFIGKEILPELLIVSKVGIYVDMPDVEPSNLKESKKNQPYIYAYKVEDIINWDNDDYTSVYLRDNQLEFDEYGFATGTKKGFRRLWQDDAGRVWVQVFDEKEKETEAPRHLENLTKIPFVMGEISSSLMEDVADYQIALLNIASSDIGYTLKSNFPFYTEQFDARAQGSEFLTGGDKDENGDSEITVGDSTGRRYPLNTERPAFINPSSEPLMASMKKQAQLKEEIRLLLNLSLTSIKTVGSVSAESKDRDQVTLESGLANIGLTLEKIERSVAKIWCEYLGDPDVPTINYPVNYSLRTSQDRLQEATSLTKLLPIIPSRTYQREIGKKITRVMLSQTVDSETLTTIDSEIDEAVNMISDPDVISQDIESGLLSPETGSILRGYPEGEAAKAEIAHEKRLTRIALAQSSEPTNKDTELPGEFKEQKKESRETDEDGVVTSKTRGEAQ